MKKSFLSIIAIFTILLSGIINSGMATVNDNKPKNDKLVLNQVKDDPTISFRVWFKVGAQDDPKGKEGLAYLTSALLTEGGTISLTYDQLLEKMYPLASSYDANAGMEMTIFEGRIHKDNLKEYLSLFTDQLLNPGFREDDFNRVKDDALSYLTTTLKYSSDEELGKAVLYGEVYTGTSYGRPVIGTISGIKNITLQDVKDFYKKFFNKSNYVLGLGGGFDESLVTTVVNDLNKLPMGTENVTIKPSVESIEGFNVTLVEKKAASTAISMGFPINVLRGEKDWYALAIANSWFGEHRNSSSHLYQVIRELRGLNYGDYSYIENFPNGSRLTLPPVNVARKQQMFEIWIRPVPNDVRHFALRAALREFNSLVTNGMKKEDFELTKQFLKNYVLHFATNTNNKLAYAIDDKFYGINGSHLDKFRKMMDELTLDDVNQAIKRHLQYGNMKIAIITEGADKLKDELVNDSASPIKYSTAKDNKILTEDLIIEKYPIKIDKNKIKILKVEDLFN